MPSMINIIHLTERDHLWHRNAPAPEDELHDPLPRRKLGEVAVEEFGMGASSAFLSPLPVG